MRNVRVLLTFLLFFGTAIENHRFSFLLPVVVAPWTLFKMKRTLPNTQTVHRLRKASLYKNEWTDIQWTSWFQVITQSCSPAWSYGCLIAIFLFLIVLVESYYIFYLLSQSRSSHQKISNWSGRAPLGADSSAVQPILSATPGAVIQSWKLRERDETSSPVKTFNWVLIMLSKKNFEREQHYLLLQELLNSPETFGCVFEVYPLKRYLSF